ncbi:hypothetical protein [Algoriphagus sp. CAU 1675]|uniref:hypothetical protein n=1 Tax=Algoriphagus sp. CAU 1675 TaxID=3032597 RepID=UPI0023D9896D|nr:hypothetical protein [Algoriphagus sp. CAU 1675]MDF2157429.1 hypothetical protein [Algoriphagus sp. CAU 1675]
MKTQCPKIILVNKLEDSSKSSSIRISKNANIPFALDPILLLEKVDWLNLGSSYGAFHSFYGELFDSLILDQRDLVVFWPTNTPPDQYWFDILSICDSAGLKLETAFSQEPKPYDLPENLSVSWKRFVEFLLKSIGEELATRISSEEIAVLTNQQESIVLLRNKNRDSLSYSFLVNSDVSIGFSLVPTEHDDIQLPEYSSFVELIENLNNELDLSLFQVNFQNSGMEKIYFNTLRNQQSHFNLINHWLNNYSVN